jgi:uncharacterized membrane protein YdjX (TVP38/TMEM64 family)
LAQPAELALPPAPGRALLRAGVVALLLMGAGLLLRYSGGDLRAFRPTVAGAVALIAAGAVLTAGGLPRQVVAFAGGYVFGAWAGGALSLVAQMLGCGLDYMAARGLAGAWARRRLARGGRLAGVHQKLAAHPFSATLTLRLLPVGNNVLLNLLAGVAGVPAHPFLAATLIGYLPQTIIFALLGSGIQIGRTTQLVTAALLFAAAAGVGWLLLGRQSSAAGRPD